ncbi:MAG: hypothetical protein WCP91_01870 [Candidatus Berkelbacteria bacterium]
MYSNNFDEVEDDDFEKIVQIIRKYLIRFNLYVRSDQIKEAPVRVINYSKNIILTDHCTCSMIMRELRKADISKMVDITEREYKNGGQTLYFHTNSSQFVIYDKIKELESAKISEKRSVDKSSAIQLNLLEQLIEEPLEVLRLEVRLNDKRKIKQTLESLGLKKNISFESLFKQNIAKFMLLHYWEDVSAGLNLVDLGKKAPIDSLETITKNNPKLSRQKALAIIGAAIIINENGSRAIRNIIESKWNTKEWYRQKNDLLRLVGPKTAKLEYINMVEKSLLEFKKLSYAIIKQ